MSNYSECLTSAAVGFQIIILVGGRLRPESVAGIERSMHYLAYLDEEIE